MCLPSGRKRDPGLAFPRVHRAPFRSRSRGPGRAGVPVPDGPGERPSPLDIERVFDSREPPLVRQGARPTSRKFMVLCCEEVIHRRRSHQPQRHTRLRFPAHEAGRGVGRARRAPHQRSPHPLAVEFARAASRRSGAPTLAPVGRGGARVFGALLVLHSGVDLERVRDALYRREINQVGTELTYDSPNRRPPIASGIGHLRDHLGCAHLLYAQLPATLDPDPTDLARRAIASAEATTGAEGRDGISYLMGIKANGIETPLTPALRGGDPAPDRRIRPRPRADKDSPQVRRPPLTHWEQ